MSKELFNRVKREINLVEYIASTCSIEVTGGNGSWNINPNPFDMQTNDNFKVSYKDGVWLYNSFNSEDGGTIIDFIQQKEGVFNGELIYKLNELLENKNFLTKPEITENKCYEQETLNNLIKFIDTNAVEYFKKRGLSTEIIEKYKLGTAENGIVDMYLTLGMKSHPKMKDHKYIIPCCNEEKNLKFIVARNYKESLQAEDKKTWNIKGIQTYFLNQFYLEGHKVNDGDVIIITESWGDALAAESVNNKIKAVALHSVAGVKKLGQLLTSNRDKLNNIKFIIAFNNDKESNDGKSPGKLATNRAIKIMNQLEFEYEVFRHPIYNDLNEWLIQDKKSMEKELNIIANRLENTDKLNINGDVKDAFFSYIGQELRYILNSNDDRKFLHWNGCAWIKKTEEESRLIYGRFIKECEAQFQKNRKMGKYSAEDSARFNKKIKSWNTTSKAKECLSLIGMNEELTLDLNSYKKPFHIHISFNGKIIDLKKGEIRNTNKEDLIIDTSIYNLVSKEEAIKFMEENILGTYKEVLGEERLNFLLDFLASKMIGKNHQLAIINIGPSKCGKSMFKNLTTKLFHDQVAHIPYTYLTTAHKGNSGAERDDIIVNLDKKLFALASEADKNNAPIAIGRFKNLLSNSITDARATGGKMQNGIDLTHLDLLIDTNEMPSFNGYDDAIENRLVFVKWENAIPLEKRIDDFNNTILAPNMDKIWTYFVYRAIELKDKNLSIPDIVKKDSASCKSELDRFTMNVVTKLRYEENKFLDLNTVIEKLEILDIFPKLKKTDSIHEDVTNKLRAIPGFEKIIKYRRGKRKVPGIKGIALVE